MNIHHASLFPDIIGASSFCNAEVPEDSIRLALQEPSLKSILGIDIGRIPIPRGTLAGEIVEDVIREPATGDDTPTPDDIADQPSPPESECLQSLATSADITPALEEKIACELNRYILVDWQHKESIQAAMRKEIRRILRANDFSAERSQILAKEIVEKLVSEELKSTQEAPPDDLQVAASEGNAEREAVEP
jgi:hypothetical protein